MFHRAMHDVLIDLLNRALLTERLARAIGSARRHRAPVAQLFLDLDKFKEINDSPGHVAGDRLLRAVAGRLLTCVRATDTVCRQGGDELVFLLVGTKDSRDAAQVADELLATGAASYAICDGPVAPCGELRREWEGGYKAGKPAGRLLRCSGASFGSRRSCLHANERSCDADRACNARYRTELGFGMG